MRPLTDCLSQSILLMTLGSWEHPPTQSYLENSLLNSLKLTQIGHFFFAGGDTLTLAAETESDAAPKLYVQAVFGDWAWI